MGQFKGLFGWMPQNDAYQNVIEFISKKVASSPDVEIEARLGKIVLTNADADSDLSRHGLPVETMCQVNREKMHTNVRFESGVPHEKLKHFNKTLNNWLTNSQNPEVPPSKQKFYPNIGYKRTTHIDRFFEIEDSKNRIRETRDPKSGKILNTIIKEGMGSMEFHMPKTDFDFRISASLEKPVPPVPSDRNPDTIRKKNRLSYTFECFSIDITTVESWENPTREIAESVMDHAKAGTTTEFPPTSRTYEIELEVADIKFLRKQRQQFATKQGNCFQQLCITFFNHCIHLCHTATQKAMPTLCTPILKRKRQPQTRMHPHQLPGHYRPAKKRKEEHRKEEHRKD